jgi:ABC-type antimicrobial peptide transport system permease subunit
MLRNLFLVAIRNLRKNSLYSVINISGLSIGIACSILILLWVVDELSFDRFIPKSDRIYQVYVNAEFDGSINTWRSVPLPTYEAMKTVDNDIVNTVVTGWGYEHLLTVGDTRVFKDAYWVSEEFLEIFEFPLVAGDPSTVLDDPLSIVISESTAKALFGEEDPINKLVKLGEGGELKVTGILKDVPQNSSFEFDFLVPWKYREQINEWVVDNQDNWGNYSFQIFLELSDKSKAGSVEENIKEMLTEKGQDDIEREFFIYPMERWRLHSQFENGVEKGGIIEYVQLFSVIAIFILVIACINFMNLATARSEKRLKEVGIRKSIGSRRIDLIFQFLGESIVITLISFVIAIVLVLLVLPFYNQMVEKELALDISSPFFWMLSTGLILFTGLMGGSYPAFYLSSFSPVRTLKGSITIGKNASLPRRILVILQFGVAIILMIGTVIIYQQIELVKNRDLGYDMNNLITTDFTDELRENYETLKNEILQSGAVESMTRSNSAITQINSNNFLGWPGKPEDLRVIFTTITSEYDYTKTMGIEVLQGRDFSEDFKSDTAAIVINKAALDLMQLENPIGTELDLWGDKRTLVGVVDDVLMGSLYREVKPMFIILNDWGGVITLRLNKNNDYQSSLATVKEIFEEINPAYPFDYKFVDSEFEEKFTTIKLTRRLAIIFAVLAILITGLGLFGLASYTAEQRTKEIGIRKVMGATVPNLVSLMSRDFSILVVVSFLLSAPLAWVLLDKYLEKYPIRIDMQWWIFPITGLVALLFALFIVSNQARKAAQANPVDSLRNE